MTDGYAPNMSLFFVAGNAQRKRKKNPYLTRCKYIIR